MEVEQKKKIGRKGRKKTRCIQNGNQAAPAVAKRNRKRKAPDT